MANIQFPTPQADGETRRIASLDARLKAATLAAGRPAVPTTTNGEDSDGYSRKPFSFTKGLPHDDRGLVASADYAHFVDAINASSPMTVVAPFDVPLGPNGPFKCTRKDGAPITVRAWESPRAGHVADLQGADAAALAISPAPSVGSDELAAEMAEVYALALLRDVPFTDIRANTPPAAEMLDALKGLPWFDLTRPVSGIFAKDGDPVSQNETARRLARFGTSPTLDAQAVFRGSGAGVKDGPYVSQFMLAGSGETPENGVISYGAQSISQKVATFPVGLDYMGDWNSWLDVQNGADLKKLQEPGDPRYITSPRDLASYVRIDQLYQAYLNAALLLLGNEAVGFDSGMPSGAASSKRGSFATFGPPHLLALLTEVSSRGLKAVRRQKFNFHRRARPERIGAMLTLAAVGDIDGLTASEQLNLMQLHDELNRIGILPRIAAHNAVQASHADNPLDGRGDKHASSLLLPMAFVEGSPMHPAYGAGHATVAGACVTILKAFFQTLKPGDSWQPRSLNDIGMTTVLHPDKNGKTLIPSGDAASDLTLEGELNKLAANISIGRNMAGVHYYSDYYESLRLGERLAVTILEEQMVTYPEPWSLRFNSFDGTGITIANSVSAKGLQPKVTIQGRSYSDWLAFGAHRTALLSV